ncbi:MAG TPA: cupin domain-containing protein [Anaeromyxobacteraceae bacterium]|nr:cupin domain-containing protein [Anaeromyxobacteraceae bacterium]
MRTRVVGVLAAGMMAIPSGRAGADKEEGFLRVTPDEVVWTERPGYEGVQFATLAGDPSKPGIYVIRAKFSPGRMTRPHWHPEDRHVIVVSGTWYTGEGDTFDPGKTVPLKAGSYMKHPARAHHYDGAKEEEVVVQIVGYGPSGTTLVHPDQGHTGSSLGK